MKKYNFIIVITFVSFLALFFAQSVYDSSVHARMQKMGDDHLADVDAASLDINMNLNIRTTTGLVRWADNLLPDALQFGSVTIDNGTDGTPMRLETMLSWDLGSADSTLFENKTWILGSNMMFPGGAYPGQRVLIRDPAVVLTSGTTRSLGNHIVMNGIAVGQDVTAVTPQLDTQWSLGRLTSWQAISSEGSGVRGLEAYGEIAAYINNIQWDWGRGTGSANQINVNGLYIYGMMQQSTPNASNGAGWSTRTGATKLGGVFPLYDVTTGTIVAQTEQLYNSADVGSDGTNSRPRLNTPMSGSIRAREFIFGTRHFGPIGVDDLNMYKQEMIFHQL